MTEKDLNIIWKKFHNSLLYFIKKRIKHAEDADDILQEVFIKISKAEIQLNSIDQFSSYIYKVTKNSIIDYWRKNRTESENTFDLNFDPVDLSEKKNHFEIKALNLCVEKMVEYLPDKYSLIFDLYENQKLSHKEIAEKLNISVSGSKTRLQRARSKLKEMLIQYCCVEADKYGNILNSCATEIICKNCEDF